MILRIGLLKAQLVNGNDFWIDTDGSRTPSPIPSVPGPMTIYGYSKPFDPNILKNNPREALTQLLEFFNPLSYRWPQPIPPYRRICRFCRKPGAVEDETHILVECQDIRLLQLREEQLLVGMCQLHPVVRQVYHYLPSKDFLNYILCKDCLLTVTAQYVYEVFELVKSVPCPRFPKRH